MVSEYNDIQNHDDLVIVLLTIIHIDVPKRL